MPVRVQSVERAAAILQVLASEQQPMSLAHLAQALGLAKATAHGLVQTLREVGFVDQDPATGRYAVGAGLLTLGASALDRNELRTRALNWTDALAARTGSAVLLATREGDRALVVHHVFRPDSSPQAMQTGAERSLHASALGKVLLAHDPRSLRGTATTTLESYTYRTITEPAQLVRELAGVRDAGWAADVEEWEPELASIAAPVRDRTGFVVAAVGLTGPVDALCDARHRPRQALATQVVDAGQSISRELGHGRP